MLLNSFYYGYVLDVNDNLIITKVSPIWAIMNFFSKTLIHHHASITDINLL
ncbi:MAG: hypothetical protein ACI94Y_002473 [Maribacter sp.]|jgi:hypothetical protein